MFCSKCFTCLWKPVALLSETLLKSLLNSDSGVVVSLRNVLISGLRSFIHFQSPDVYKWYLPCNLNLIFSCSRVIKGCDYQIVRLIVSMRTTTSGTTKMIAQVLERERVVTLVARHVYDVNFNSCGASGCQKCHLMAIIRRPTWHLPLLSFVNVFRHPFF